MNHQSVENTVYIIALDDELYHSQSMNDDIFVCDNLMEATYFKREDEARQVIDNKLEGKGVIMKMHYRFEWEWMEIK